MKPKKKSIKNPLASTNKQIPEPVVVPGNGTDAITFANVVRSQYIAFLNSGFSTGDAFQLTLAIVQNVKPLG